jgi:catechol 2,3-dioxygenase-like lactoylglutathione lyase family enzyme
MMQPEDDEARSVFVEMRAVLRPRKGDVMLASKNAIATIAVKDTKAAKQFYEGKLGLKPERTEEPGVLAYKSGGSTLFVYESRYAGTNKATAATWVVDDVEGEVKSLREKGVSFEHYDMPETTRKGDVHVSGKTMAAWFKDPDGNILSLVNG